MTRTTKPKPTKPKRKVGRPSLYSPELADHICSLIMDGESMIAICKRPGMPDRGTVIRWLETLPDFATKHAHARAWQAEHMDDLILDTAKRSKAETAAADRVKIAAYQWRAAKLKPKVYGDKADVNVNHQGAIQMTITKEDLGTL